MISTIRLLKLGTVLAACLCLPRPAAAQVPDPPTGLAAVPHNDGSFTLTWSPPPSSGGGALQGYAVQIGVGPGLSNVGTFTVGASVTMYRTAVVPQNTQWFARVFAFNGFGFSNPSNEVTLTSTQPCPVPSAPLGLTWRVFASGVQLTWAEPLQHGGISLFRYRLEVGTTSGASDATVIEVGSLVTNANMVLPPGTFYARVLTTNLCGVRGPTSSEAVIDTTMLSAPSATMVVNEFGLMGVELRNVSSSPIDIGGWFLRGTRGAPDQIGIYGGAFPTGTIVPPGCTYLLSEGGPALGFDTRGHGGHGAALVRPNGQIVDSVGLRKSDSQDGSHSPFIEGTGLRPLQDWDRFGVQSAARIGPDGDSNAGNFIELQAHTLQGLEVCPGTPVPPPPPFVSTFVDPQRQVIVSWQRVPSTSGYTLEIGTQPSSGNVFNQPVGNVNQYRTAPLSPGTYYVRLRSTNISGTSGPSSEVSFTISQSIPSPPHTLQATVTGSMVQLTWLPPATGGAVSDYILEAGSSSTLADLYNASVGATTSLAATAGPGVYFVRVRARNGFGTSAPSNEVVVTIGSNLPGAPLNPSATVAPNRTVTLAWTAPQSGGPVETYIIEAGSAPGLRDLANIPVGSAPNVAVAGVPPGTYHVRIRARNPAGVGPPSIDIVVVVP
jgi:hypothetical protein